MYEYAVLRVVPRVERGEFINAGLVLYCPAERFLRARVHLDRGRLRALDPALDPERALAHLESVQRVCEGGKAAGSLGELPARERFGRVVAPKSTVVQPSPVHTGFCEEPEREIDRLLRRMVCPPR